MEHIHSPWLLHHDLSELHFGESSSFLNQCHSNLKTRLLHTYSSSSSWLLKLMFLLYYCFPWCVCACHSYQIMKINSSSESYRALNVSFNHSAFLLRVHFLCPRSCVCGCYLDCSPTEVTYPNNNNNNNTHLQRRHILELEIFLVVLLLSLSSQIYFL